MKFWPFPVIRNYATDPVLTSIFLRFAEADDLSVVERDIYWLTVKCSLGTLCFWNENKWYAWGNSGSYKLDHGLAFKWEGEMPSRYAVRAMRKALEAKNPLQQAMAT